MAVRKDKGQAGPSQRQLRVGELVRHALTSLISRGDIPEDVLTRAFITIPEVRMSPDLKLATAYLVLHDKSLEKGVLEALKRHHKYLRSNVAQRVNLKFAPDLRFRLDYRLDSASKIDQLLRRPEVQRDLMVDEPDQDQDHDHDDLPDHQH
jgi:ribosome-binding factor A